MNTQHVSVSHRLIHRSRLACLLIAVCAITAPSMAAVPDDNPDALVPAFEAAMQHYETSHWAPAYAGLAGLADQGNASAARSALLMWAYGTRLYGQSFAATPEQAARWARLAGCEIDVASRTDASACTLVARRPRATELRR